jgi:hypothetical protein
VTESALARTVRRVRWELKTIAGMYPWLCRLTVRRSGEYPTEETELVIEGFPRSGNTFAVVAFLAAQARLVSVAHHVHAPAPVITAAQLGIPALVLIREPEGAVLSTVIRYPHISISQALRGYARFHSPLVARRGSFVVGRFDEVVTDFGAVIRRVNAEFGTSFGEFEHSPENVEEALATVDRWDRDALGEGEELDRGRARPTPTRATLKEALRERYGRAGLSGARGKAERLFAALTSGG